MSICARHLAHSAPPPRCVSISRSARSTAASKRCSRTPNSRRGVVVAGQQVVLERLHQRRDQPGSSPAIAAATHRRDRGQVEAAARARAVEQHRVGDPLDQLAVAHASGPPMSHDAAGVRRRDGRGGERGTRARRGRRSAACGWRARRAARARAGARSAAPGSGTSASGRRSRSRRAARPTRGDGVEQRLLDRQAAEARWRDARAVGGHAGRRGRRSAARRPRAAAAANARPARRSRVGEAAVAGPRSIEWIR